MNAVLKFILAVVIGLVATALLDYVGVFNHSLNVLIGIVAGVVFYCTYKS